jgi:energy-coupling factor transporter ATPase
VSIAFEQVSFSYTPLTKRQKKAGEEQRYALRNVTFTLEEGEFLAIAGHTGSGKSTLVQHINGLANPTEGRVLWNGKDLAAKEVAAQARADIGVVFQYPEHQLFAASVYEDVAFGPRNMGLTEEEVDARVRRALADVHLDFKAIGQRSPFELSGGQQRRVAFAGVLAMEPTTLVLDEPVAGLDPASRADFLALIKRLHEQRNLTVVMVSHNMNDIAALANRMLVMHEGEIAFLGTPEEIFTQHAAELREIGLGIPHAQRLSNELREQGMPLPVKLYQPETLADEIASILKAQEN